MDQLHHHISVDMHDMGENIVQIDELRQPDVMLRWMRSTSLTGLAAAPASWTVVSDATRWPVA